MSISRSGPFLVAVAVAVALAAGGCGVVHISPRFGEVTTKVFARQSRIELATPKPMTAEEAEAITSALRGGTRSQVAPPSAGTVQLIPLQR